MKGILGLNLMNMVLFGMILALFFLFPPAVGIVCIVIWAIWLVYSNYRIIVRAGDIVKDLHDACKGHIFSTDVRILSDTYLSIQNKRKFFEERSDAGGKVMQAYELLVRRAEQNIKKATDFIRNYDYRLRPDTDYVERLAHDNEALADRMQAMCSVMFEISSDAMGEVDLSRVDDLLAALQDMADEY